MTLRCCILQSSQSLLFLEAASFDGWDEDLLVNIQKIKWLKIHCANNQLIFSLAVSSLANLFHGKI